MRALEPSWILISMVPCNHECLSSVYKTLWWQPFECSWVPMAAHACNGGIISACECFWVRMSTHEQSWSSKSSHGLSWARHHENSWTFLSAPGHPWYHGTIFMSIHELSRPLLRSTELFRNLSSAHEHSWAILSTHDGSWVIKCLIKK